MTNNTQIRTKRISFVLALSVITYTAIDTYLSAYHDIDVIEIMTPVIPVSYTHLTLPTN